VSTAKVDQATCVLRRIVAEYLDGSGDRAIVVIKCSFERARSGDFGARRR
jgi:hypothetical protein